MAQEYDYIICGAGLAGLSLAIRLSDSAYSDKRILILDKSNKKINDRTWSFWAHKDKLHFPSIVRKSWSNLAFYSPGHSIVTTPRNYQYHTISGLDFYNYAFQQIEKAKHIQFVQTEISMISENENAAVVETTSGTFTGSIVFDSVVRSFPEKDPLFVWQHFLGWEVKLAKGSFDVDTATFMDFRIDQQGETRFVYVLPYTSKTALVEATIFSKEIAEPHVYEEILKDYMKRYVSDDYEIESEELGAIPMTTAPFGRSTDRIICIGTNNATVKPSSGYAFMRIQEEIEKIMDLIDKGSVRPVKRSSKFLAYDKTLLNVLLTGKESGSSVFSMMFSRNTVDKILKFLDEKTSLKEEVRIFSTLPFWSFLRAFARENVLRRTN